MHMVMIFCAISEDGATHEGEKISKAKTHLHLVFLAITFNLILVPERGVTV